MEEVKKQKEDIKVPHLPPYYYPYPDDEIDLYELYLILKKRKSVIFFTLILFTLAGILYSLLATPIYRAGATLMLLQNPTETPPFTFSGEETITIKPIRFSIPNPSVIFQSSSVINKVVNNLKPELSSVLQETSSAKLEDFVRKHLTVEKDRKTEAWNIYLEFPKDPKLTYKITVELIKSANQVANKIYKDYLLEQLSVIEKQLNSLRLKLSKTKDNVRTRRILETLLAVTTERYETVKALLEKDRTWFLTVISPKLPEKPFKPKKKLIVAVSATSGLFLGVFLAFFLEWLENARKRAKQNNG